MIRHKAMDTALMVKVTSCSYKIPQMDMNINQHAFPLGYTGIQLMEPGRT